MLDGIIELQLITKNNFSIFTNPELEKRIKIFQELEKKFATPNKAIENAFWHMQQSIATKYTHHYEGYIVLMVWKDKMIDFWNNFKKSFDLYLKKENLPQSTSFENSGLIIKAQFNLPFQSFFLETRNAFDVLMEATNSGLGLNSLGCGYNAWNVLKKFTAKYVEVLTDNVNKYVFYNVYLPNLKIDLPIPRLELNIDERDYIQCTKYNYFKQIIVDCQTSEELQHELYLLKNLKENLLSTDSKQKMQILLSDFHKDIHTQEMTEYFPKFLDNYGIVCEKKPNGNLLFQIDREKLLSMTLHFRDHDHSNYSHGPDLNHQLECFR